MKILTLLGFLVLLTTSPMTNCTPGLFNAAPSPIYLPKPVAGFSSFGSNFGSLALVLIVLGALMQPSSKCPTGYTSYSANCGQICYRFESQNCKSWTDARAACQGEGADLWVPDACSYSYFQGLAKQRAASCNGFWIGALRVPPTADYMTLRGAPIPVIFPFWASGQPDRTPRNPGVDSCVKMSNEYNFLMSDDPCVDVAGFVCQKSI